jgi:hypothetical protein
MPPPAHGHLWTRRRFLGGILSSAPGLTAGAPALAATTPGKPVPTTTLSAGDLKVVFRDNARSPEVLGGVTSLVNTRDAPGFDAIDPDSPGASAGLNFEHIIAGHKNRHNAFSPRHGRYTLYRLPGGKSARLVRRREDDPWAMSNTLTYTLTPPHFIDLDFRCVPHDRALFGRRGYAVLFFADYMNDVADPALHFRGVERPSGKERWIRADAPKGHGDWNGGGTYRSLPAAGLEYDKDHNFKLNSWSYDWPRFAKPFYYGRAARGMVFQLMFDRMHGPADEIRFSLFKFKLPRFPRPAWDFQYVIRKIEQGKEYGFRARAVWKKFVSAEDCLKEYETWAKAVSVLPVRHSACLAWQAHAAWLTP